jgi:hypothetical protein
MFANEAGSPVANVAQTVRLVQQSIKYQLEQINAGNS